MITRIRPKPWDDRPARSGEDHHCPLAQSLQSESHADRCPTSRTGEMAMTQILCWRYFYFFHSSLILVLAVIGISGYQVVDIGTSGHQVYIFLVFCFPDILVLWYPAP
jgi:hypothetical protein